MVIKLGVRYRKYFSQCKPIECGGRKGKYCPNDRPKRSSGEYKTCGVWCLEFFDDNKQWQSLTFKDIRCKTEAGRRLAIFIGDRERGQLNLPKGKVITTLAEYSKIYLELSKAAKENTRLSKQRAVNSLVKHLGHYQLNKITPFLIEKYRIARKEADKVKESSINIDFNTLSHLFNIALTDGIIDKNPCKSVKRFKTVQTRDRVLSDAEIALLFDKLQGKDRLIFIVGLFTGMRLGEILGLKWNNIDSQKGLISFTQSKTGKLITIPLSTYIANMLNEYRQNCTGEHLFENREITHAIVGRYSNRFSALFKQFGIDNFTFHNLRHCFSSLQAELGTGAIITKDILGHSNLNMTLRYSHTNLESKQKAIQGLTDRILSIKEKVIRQTTSKLGTA